MDVWGVDPVRWGSDVGLTGRSRVFVHLMCATRARRALPELVGQARAGEFAEALVANPPAGVGVTG